eukprot:CAMPEP_0184480844 /NCGR_PEP_ID=MMETSP0113_2-20130426/2341_1 /TAXON_ID=91329 /ORGANISM="Norrisiella sphaerica, Strain BC52" /LENGTH=177 /DNA_ID=CAMNT_0026859577 /DNA_START=32 /DNA_END=565 /DNA_ORIENTATION=+
MTLGLSLLLVALFRAPIPPVQQHVLSASVAAGHVSRPGHVASMGSQNFTPSSLHGHVSPRVSNNGGSSRRGQALRATVSGDRPIYTSMQAKLSEKLEPKKLEIIDDSKGHVEHEAMVGKAAESGETHFTVEIVSDAFEGVNLVKRHRMVYDILKEELDAGVHALSLKTKTPKEAGLA